MYWLRGPVSSARSECPATHSFAHSSRSPAVTALSTGLGALPFVFLSTLRSGLVGIANSVAAGMMLAASIVLLAESFTAEEGSKVDTSAMFAGLQHDSVLGLGLGLGAVFVALSERYLENASDDALTGLSEFGSRRAILFVAVMTVHSLAEGIGIGVSFHGSSGLQTGSVISAALAVHNIPEGMAGASLLISLSLLTSLSHPPTHTPPQRRRRPSVPRARPPRRGRAARVPVGNRLLHSAASCRRADFLVR